MQRCLGVFVLGCLLAGCGGEKSAVNTGDAAGGAGDDVPSGGKSSSSAGGSNFAAPPSQGAFTLSVMAASPPPPGLACPTSPITSSVPDTSDMPAQALDEDTYVHNVVDGEDGASVSCRVASSNGWVVEANIFHNGRGLRIAGGQIAETGEGTATITVMDAQRLPSQLTSDEPCVVTAMKAAGSNFQVKAGSMWAGFECTAIESPPTSSCAAEGIVVVENCAQD